MRFWTSNLIRFGVLLLLTAALIELTSRPAPLPAFASPATSSCRARPLSLDGELYPRSTQATPEGILLTLPATLTAQACALGTWQIRAASAGTGDVPPVLTVSLNGKVVSSVDVTGQRTLEVPVGGPGRLNLSFLNKTYEVGLRDVKILQVLLRGPRDCQEVRGTVDIGSGAWQDATASGRLFGHGPLALQTCPEGAAVLRLQGNVFEGAAPRLSLQADSGPARVVELTGVRTVTVPLSGRGNLTLQLLNPASRTTQNSQLKVQAHFIPQ